ncbi:MAG: hypothetical protein J6W76_02000, partial [Spirochaetales bacterium]|nr:hypothetical protein [Spirochaetales bacterium]
RDYSMLDYFQNKTFTLWGNVDDDYPIEDITITMSKANDVSEDVVYMFHINTDSLSESAKKTYNTSITGTMYNWNIKIDSTENITSNDGNYINRLGSLSPAVRHYLKVTVTVLDKAGNESINYNKADSYLCLYQEADRPWSEVASLNTVLTEEQEAEVAQANDKNAARTSAQQSNSDNKLHSAAPISAVAYDDDGVSSIEYRIVKTDNAGVYQSEITYQKKTYADFGETKCATWQIQAPSITGYYKLYYRMTDINGTTSFGDNTSDWTVENGWLEKDSIGFRIIDDSAPNTDIKAFESYPQTAYITEETPCFVIEGTTRDSAGLTSVTLAWDPSADNQCSQYLKNERWTVSESRWGDCTADNRVRYWSVNLDNATKFVDANNIVSTRWTYKIPLSDFVSESGIKIYNLKKMYYCVTSIAGTYGSGAFTIPRDYNPPNLTITSPKNNSECRNVPGDRFDITGNVSDPEIGIASLQVKYPNIEGDTLICDISCDETGLFNISSEILTGLSGGYQKISVRAADYFGNISDQSVIVQIDDDSPIVSSISADNNAGYYSSGKLTFSVTMSREITIIDPTNDTSADIRLYLNCNTDAYAVFTELDSTNKIMKFEYTIKQGDNNDNEPLDYTSTDSIVVNSGMIRGRVSGSNMSEVTASLTLPTPGEAGSISSRGIYVDTVAPTIRSWTTDK